MEISEDIALLHQAGISERDLIRGAAQFLREHPRGRTPASPPLTEREVQLLRGTGAAGLDGAGPASVTDIVPVGITVEYRRLADEAFSKEEVSRRLGVVDSRVRQRARERSLYFIDGPEGRLYPRFQFDDEGTHTLPELRRVLVAIDEAVHPVS